MELYEYFKILTKYLKQILFASVALSILAYGVSFYFPTNYRASVTVYVQRIPEKPAAGDYTYDGFYAQKAAEAYTDTVFGFLTSIDILQRAAKVAKLPADSQSLAGFAKKIKIEKVAPQLIDVRVTLKDKNSAKDLALSLAQSAQERVSLLNQEGNTGLTINLANPEPFLAEVKPWKELNAAVGFLAGLIFTTAGVFLREYLKEEGKSNK